MSKEGKPATKTAGKPLDEIGKGRQFDVRPPQKPVTTEDKGPIK